MFKALDLEDLQGIFFDGTEHLTVESDMVTFDGDDADNNQQPHDSLVQGTIIRSPSSSSFVTILPGDETKKNLPIVQNFENNDDLHASNDKGPILQILQAAGIDLQEEEDAEDDNDVLLWWFAVVVVVVVVTS